MDERKANSRKRQPRSATAYAVEPLVRHEHVARERFQPPSTHGVGRVVTVTGLGIIAVLLLVVLPQVIAGSILAVAAFGASFLWIRHRGRQQAIRSGVALKPTLGSLRTRDRS